MKLQRIRGRLSIPVAYLEKCRKAVLFSSLTFSVTVTASETGGLGDGYNGYFPGQNDSYDHREGFSDGYTHSAWWIAGIAAVSVAGMGSSSIDNDKKQHFGISLAMGASSEYGLRQFNISNNSRWGRIALATSIGIVPGIIKEVTDDSVDKNDLLADALGSFTGALLSDLIQGPVVSDTQYGVLVGSEKVGLVINYPF